MLTKNAMGNLINRYKAVLKKCHLLNTLGLLALVGALTLGVGLANVETAFGASLTDITSETIAPDESRSAGTLNYIGTTMLSHITGTGDSIITGDKVVLFLTGNSSNILSEGDMRVENEAELHIRTNNAVTFASGTTLEILTDSIFSVVGDLDLSQTTLTTDASARLSSDFGSTLTVDIASIGVDDHGANSGAAATVNAGTNVISLDGTVRITGFDSGLNFKVYDGGTINTAYAALNTAASEAYGTGANIVFDRVTLDTTGLTLTHVADNSLVGLGESSVDSGTVVGSGKRATVGSVRTEDASGVSATNAGGRLTITGQSTEIGQANKISVGDVIIKGVGSTHLGNISTVSSVGGSVISDNTTTAGTTLLNVDIAGNLENSGTGSTFVTGTNTVQGNTTLNANADLQVYNSSGTTQSNTFTVQGDTTLNGGTLRTTNFYSGNNINGATASFLHNLPNGIDGNIITEQNSYTVLGGNATNNGRTYAESTFGISNHDWGTGVTAALFIVTPQRMAPSGSIKVDGKSAGVAAAATKEALFAANSLLVVDAAGMGSNAALTAATGGKLTVESSAKLLISGASAGTVTVASGFTDGTSSIATKAWGYDDASLENVSTDRATLKIGSVAWNNGVFSVTFAQNGFVLDGVDESVRNFMNAARDAGVSGPFFDFMDNITIPAGQRVKASETMPQAAVISATARGAMNAASTAAGAIIQRNEVGAIGTQRLTSMNMNNGEIGLNAGDDMQSTSGKGIGIWAMPLYKWSDVSGVESGILDGGYKTGLGGMSLGADYTFDNSLRVGLAFNLGAGYTESTGDFSGTNNNFDFWGLSLYAGYEYDNFGFSADIGYSASTHDVTQKMGATSFETDILSNVWTVGLSADYTFNTSFADITPHVGVRYMGVTTYGYDMAGLEMDSDHQGVWYFPMGVTLSKDVVMDSGWTFTPKVDVGIIAAAGDLKANSTAGMAGVNANIGKETTNVDGFAFNGGLGFDLANADNGISLGLNYNLQASEHETGHMVFATFRYEF